MGPQGCEGGRPPDHDAFPGTSRGGDRASRASCKEGGLTLPPSPPLGCVEGLLLSRLLPFLRCSWGRGREQWAVLRDPRPFRKEPLVPSPPLPAPLGGQGRGRVGGQAGGF